MKKYLLSALFTFPFAVAAMAANNVTYDASAGPDSNPDSTQGVDVWTVVVQAASPQGGSYFQSGSLGGGSSLWAIFDVNTTGQTTATHTFAGGSLLTGQTVSIDYAHNTNINDFGPSSPAAIGIRLLDASNNVQAEFGFRGGGSNFIIRDAGTNTSYVTTTKAYDANDVFNVSFTLGASNMYSGMATQGSNASGGSGNWSGSFTSAVTQIQIFTFGGDNSDQYFDNLTVVPEPSTYLAGAALLAGLIVREWRKSGKLAGFFRRSKATI